MVCLARASPCNITVLDPLLPVSCCARTAGATGGFAGGERGLRAYVETGEVRIRKPGEPGGQPMSPLSIAFLMLLAGAGGAALLTQFSAGEAGLPDAAVPAVSPADALQVG